MTTHTESRVVGRVIGMGCETPEQLQVDFIIHTSRGCRLFVSFPDQDAPHLVDEMVYSRRSAVCRIRYPLLLRSRSRSRIFISSMIASLRLDVDVGENHIGSISAETSVLIDTAARSNTSHLAVAAYINSFQHHVFEGEVQEGGAGEDDEIPSWAIEESEALAHQADSACPPASIAKNLKIDNGVEDGVCPICIENLEAGEEIGVLPCNHFFHPNCISRWLGYCFREIDLFATRLSIDYVFGLGEIKPLSSRNDTWLIWFILLMRLFACYMTNIGEMENLYRVSCMGLTVVVLNFPSQQNSRMLL